METINGIDNLTATGEISRVICLKCQFDGTKSTVVLDNTLYESDNFLVTNIFWDEDGLFHNHPEGHSGVGYKCSLGHCWLHISKTCPSCAWSIDEMRTNWE